ncbi:UNVERIFIED_CONTAM: hypothetical protein RMT77_018744 [Armadillidium vulgare]
MSNMEGSDREVTKADQADSVVTTTVKIDNIKETRDSIVEPSTNNIIYTTQRGTIQPNLMQTSNYQSPIFSTVPLFNPLTSTVPSNENFSSGLSNPIQQQQPFHFNMPNIQQQQPIQTQPYQTPPNYTLIDSGVLTELLAQNRELIAQNQQMLQILSQLVQQLSLQSRPKKMIPLGKYRLEDGETFPQFLNRFEDYVRTMYPNSSNDEWRTYLGLHLEGHIKTVYELLMKNNSGYTVIIHELTQWFNKYILKQNKTDQVNFDNAVMEHNETIPLFALRLQGLAEKAFPTADIETLTILREKLIKSLPLHLQQTVKSHAMVCEFSRREELSWDDLVNIVDQIYAGYITQELPQRSFPTTTPSNPVSKTTPELIDLTNYQPQTHAFVPVNPIIDTNQCSVVAQPPNVSPYFSNPPSFAQIAAQQQKSNGFPQKQIYNSNRFNNNNRFRNKTPPRTPSDNTTKTNDRSQKQEWNRTPRNNNRPNSSNVTCNYCKKPGHDVRECRSRPYCKFCGKRGHLYNNCYQRQNKCIHCEENGHVVNNCPNRQQKKQEHDNSLECTECGGPHLGKDCPQFKPPSYSHQEN